MDRGFVFVLSAVCCGLSARRAVSGVCGSFFGVLPKFLSDFLRLKNHPKTPFNML